VVVAIGPMTRRCFMLSLLALVCCLSAHSNFVLASITVTAIDESHENDFAAGQGRKLEKVERVRKDVSTASAKNAANNDTTTPYPHQSMSQILAEAGKKGLGGGIPGFVAGVIQVLTLMWLRTVVNYQCRYGTNWSPLFSLAPRDCFLILSLLLLYHCPNSMLCCPRARPSITNNYLGTTFRQSLITLFNNGGIPRFYRGLAFALVQAPLSRFVATAANEGVETLLTSMETTSGWGAARKTGVSSLIVGAMRMLLMPIDTCKTVLQVDSAEGFRNLMRKVKAGKIGLLYQGCFAVVVSSMVGYYPWFYTYNFLSNSETVRAIFQISLLRNAFIGFSASVFSDVVSNSIKVLKTTKQSMGSRHAVSYREAISIIVSEDGWRGLFGRGLKTRIFGNALQSILFIVIWRGLADRWGAESQDKRGEDEEVQEYDYKAH